MSTLLKELADLKVFAFYGHPVTFSNCQTPICLCLREAIFEEMKHALINGVEAGQFTWRIATERRILYIYAELLRDLNSYWRIVNARDALVLIRKSIGRHHDALTCNDKVKQENYSRWVFEIANKLWKDVGKIDWLLYSTNPTNVAIAEGIFLRRY